MEKKFKFNFRLITSDTTISDQNVTSFKFINLGEQNVLINNQLLLQGIQVGVSPQFFDEGLSFGEKTAQQYKVVFAKTINKTNLLQLIEKIEVRD
jgi:hypothetical protein